MLNLNRFRYITNADMWNIALFGLFIMSLFNTLLLTVYMIILLLWVLISRKEETIIEAFIWIQIRSLMNPGVGVVFASYASLLKWAMVFLLSFLIFFYKTNKDGRLSRINMAFVVYGVYLVISAVLVSSYPTVAVFKILSYLIPFIAIVKGVYDTNYVDWMSKVNAKLGVMIISSIILIPFPVGYLRNGHAFQGFFNHPNVFGVMLALFLAGFLYKQTQYSMKEIVMSVIVVALATLSGSRTGLFACLFAVIVFVFSKDIRRSSKTKIWVTVLVVSVLAFVLLNNNTIEYVNNLVFKGHADSLIYSRETQFQDNLVRFNKSPWLGTGLNVPFVEGVKSYAFSFDLVVENGNLALAVLADTGVIGTVLFCIAYLTAFVSGMRNRSIIFLIPFVVSMGEQSFFSTNNFGIILYVFIAIYISDGLSLHKKENVNYFNN